MNMSRFLQNAILGECHDCINKKGALDAYAGKLKAVSLSNDKKGILFTIRCDFPDLNENTEKRTKEGLDKLMSEGRQHMIVLQR